MFYFEKELIKIQKMKKHIEKALGPEMEGRIVGKISKGKYPQYYLAKGTEAEKRQGGKSRLKYLRKEELEMAKAMVQREYIIKLLKVLEKQEKAILRFNNQYHVDETIEVFECFPEGKRKLISTYVLPDSVFLEEWRQKHKGGKNEYPKERIFLTENEEPVRSKTEKIIADKLFFRKVPYEYEAELKLPSGVVFYPDFTILNIRTRNTFYFEHFGMMDNAEYCKKTLEKLEAYEKNGLYPGEKLLFTMECSQKEINIKNLDNIIDKYLV